MPEILQSFCAGPACPAESTPRRSVGQRTTGGDPVRTSLSERYSGPGRRGHAPRPRYRPLVKVRRMSSLLQSTARSCRNPSFHAASMAGCRAGLWSHCPARLHSGPGSSGFSGVAAAGGGRSDRGALSQSPEHTCPGLRDSPAHVFRRLIQPPDHPHTELCRRKQILTALSRGI